MARDCAIAGLVGEGALGLSPDDAAKIVDSVIRWPLAHPGQELFDDFVAGQALYFLGGPVASSEHSSIRGPINGGGDFI